MRQGIGDVKMYCHIKIIGGLESERINALEAAKRWIEKDFPDEFKVAYYDDGIIQVGIIDDDEEHLCRVVSTIWAAFERAGYKVVEVPCESMEHTHQ